MVDIQRSSDKDLIAIREMVSTNYDGLKQHYSKFLSEREKDRKFYSFWTQDLPDEHRIELGGGMPNEGFFPVQSVDVNLVDTPFQSGKSTLQAHLNHYDSPAGYPLARSFQYGETSGCRPLIDFAKYMVNKINKPAYDNWDCLLAGGSSDSMFKVFETICDRNTTVLMEEFTFTPVISNISATGATCVPVKMQLSAEPDVQGIDCDYLADLLDNWSSHEEYKHLSKPTVLYTIATGQNPTGMTLSMEKRRKIYGLAQKHDLIIVEDDPYGYLHFPKYDPSDPMRNPYDNLSTEQYISEFLVKSFLTMDTDARVIRLETFSKVFAPGLRLSFIVANRFFIERVLNLAEITTRAPSGVSQAIVYSTIKSLATREASQDNDEEAMFQGWLHWVMKVASQYAHRRNVTFKALRETEAYKHGLFSILEPSAGMFINIKIVWPENRKPDSADIIQRMNDLDQILLSSGVKVILGYKMAVDSKFSLDNCDFLRITVAFATGDEQLIEASHRIGKSIKELFDE